jgi:hypothetical protein
MIAAGVDKDVRRAVLGHAGKDAHGGYEGSDLKATAKELAEKVPPLFD